MLPCRKFPPISVVSVLFLCSVGCMMATLAAAQSATNTTTPTSVGTNATSPSTPANGAGGGNNVVDTINTIVGGFGDLKVGPVPVWAIILGVGLLIILSIIMCCLRCFGCIHSLLCCCKRK